MYLRVVSNEGFIGLGWWSRLRRVPMTTTALLAEVDRRWGGMTPGEYHQAYENRECPFNNRQPPPFSYAVTDRWLNGHGYWAWHRLNHRISTDRLMHELREALSRQHLHFQDEDWERLVTAVKRGKERRKEWRRK